MQPTVSVPTITEVKSLIDQRLIEYCSVRMETARHINERYGILWESIATLINAGGKRFRPYMLITAFSAYADDEADIESILPAAIAQELIHQAMLIHDDIIDRDTIRYGIKNVAGQYDDHYKQYLQDDAERRHMTTSSALLAGDVLISDAYRLIARVQAPKEHIVEAITLLSNGVFDVVGGELLDTESAFLTDTTIPAETIARYKTAGYSFVSPLLMGATFGGASESELRLLHQFAECLGIGYQLRDDMLGIFGNAAQTGKSTSTDITEGKRTYLIEQFETVATKKQKDDFYKIFHNLDATEIEIAQARELLQASGATDKVEAAIAHLQHTAEEIVGLLTMSDEVREVFRSLIAICLTREK